MGKFSHLFLLLIVLQNKYYQIPLTLEIEASRSDREIPVSRQSYQYGLRRVNLLYESLSELSCYIFAAMQPLMNPRIFSCSSKFTSFFKISWRCLNTNQFIFNFINAYSAHGIFINEHIPVNTAIEFSFSFFLCCYLYSIHTLFP